MKKVKLVFFMVLSMSLSAQVGVNTTTPGSTLDVNGSLSTSIKTVNTSYTLLYTDYYLRYNGGANSTIILPVGTSEACGCKGRTYEIYNYSAFSVLVKTVAGETFPNGLGEIVLQSNSSLKVVNNDNLSGNTWDVVYYGATLPSEGTFVPYVTLSGYNSTEYSIPLNSAGADGGIPMVPITTVLGNDGGLNAGSTWIYPSKVGSSLYYNQNYYSFPSSGFYQVTGSMQYGFSTAVNSIAPPYDYALALQPMFIRLDVFGVYREQIQMGANLSTLGPNYSVNWAGNWYSASNSVTKYFTAGERIGIGLQLCASCKINYSNIVTYKFREANMVVVKLSAK